MQQIDGAAAQLSDKRDGDTHQRRMRQRQSHVYLRPPILVALYRRALRDIERVPVDPIYLGQRLDKVRNVGFVPSQSGADRVRIYGDVQNSFSLPLAI